jgi:virginiamycin A acetyltransferase
MLRIHPTARVSPLAVIDDSVRGTLIEIGPNVFIDAFVRIKPVGGMGDLIIGGDCDINSGTVIFTGNGIKIGENVLIAPNCTFAATNHAFVSPTVAIRNQGFQPSKGGILIEDDVWIGSNTVVLDGSIVRRGSVIGAGSLVRGEVAAFSVSVGNPLRTIGHRRR